jgi:hypothetical protein
MEQELEDLCEVLGTKSPQVKGLDFRNYLDWESKVAQPRLEELGFTVHTWIDGERDSFGPLSRIAVTTHNGTPRRLIYG